MWIRRVIAALGLTLLAVPLTSAPAQARAADGFFCILAQVVPVGDEYRVMCGAAAGTGPRTNVTVTIAFGSSAGTYLCRTVIIEPLAPDYQLKGSGCVLI
jgi:hypothetical protein